MYRYFFQPWCKIVTWFFCASVHNPIAACYFYWNMIRHCCISHCLRCLQWSVANGYGTAYHLSLFTTGKMLVWHGGHKINAKCTVSKRYFVSFRASLCFLSALLPRSDLPRLPVRLSWVERQTFDCENFEGQLLLPPGHLGQQVDAGWGP